MELLIKNISKVIALNQSEFELFKKFWEIKKLKKDQYLLQKGQVCRHDAFVLDGALKAYFINPKTYKEEIMYFAIADWWATDLESFHTGAASDLNIQAVKPATIATISKSKFEELLLAIPKLERYFRIILQGHSSALQRRIYLRNACSAKERYHAFLYKYPEINRQIPQYLVASYLGMSAEMLSKIRSDTK
jgi:CRP/FNR family transcriptional regulator, anaerobic regulatory protein